MEANLITHIAAYLHKNYRGASLQQRERSGKSIACARARASMHAELLGTASRRAFEGEKEHGIGRKGRLPLESSSEDPEVRSLALHMYSLLC